MKDPCIPETAHFEPLGSVGVIAGGASPLDAPTLRELS